MAGDGDPGPWWHLWPWGFSIYQDQVSEQKTFLISVCALVEVRFGSTVGGHKCSARTSSSFVHA